MNTYTPEMVTAAVARGAAWLDEKCPDWVSEIDLEKLKLESPSACVLGQTAKCLTGHALGYIAVLRCFGVSDNWATFHGFNVVGTHDGEPSSAVRNCDGYACAAEMQARYEMLRIAWMTLIRERLAVPA